LATQESSEKPDLLVQQVLKVLPVKPALKAQPEPQQSVILVLQANLVDLVKKVLQVLQVNLVKLVTQAQKDHLVMQVTLVEQVLQVSKVHQALLVPPVSLVQLAP
jgi:hypothetical protein